MKYFFNIFYYYIYIIMSFALILNSSNVVSSQFNNQLIYKFINGNFVCKDYEMCITNVNLPYSIYNINQQIYNNAKFNIIWPTGTVYNVTIPNGFYTTTTLNNYIQFFCVSNGLYLIDSTNTKQFYVSIQYNSTYYANQITMTPVPTSLPSNWSNPNNFPFSSNNYTPIFQILNNNFQYYLGFTPQNYPLVNQTSTYNIISNQTPNGSQVNNIVVICNFINNALTVPNNILDSFPITNTTFGAGIIYTPQIAKMIPILDGSYNSVSFTLLDQNLNNIQLLDPNLLITILIKKKNN